MRRLKERLQLAIIKAGAHLTQDPTIAGLHSEKQDRVFIITRD